MSSAESTPGAAAQPAQVEPRKFGEPTGERGKIDITHITEAHAGEKSTKWNTQGVSPDDKYNYFFQEKTAEAPVATPESKVTTDEVQTKVLEAVAENLDDIESKLSEERAALDAKIAALEQELADLKRQVEANKAEKADRELTEKQPRRVRHIEGVTEKLVKYADGKEPEFGWVIVDVEDEKPAPTQEVAPAATVVDAAEAATVKDATEQSQAAGQVEGANQANASTETQPDDDATETQPSDSETAGDAENSEQEAQTEGAEDATETEADETDTEETETDEDAAELEGFGDEEGPELSPVLVANLNAARTKYAQLTAKHRASTRGHYLQNSSALIAIPGVRRIADWAGRKPDAEIEAARAEYAAALKELREEHARRTLEGWEDSEWLQDWVKAKGALTVIESEEQLEVEIVQNRLNDSGKISKLADWWVRQEGASGKWKRAAVIAGAATAGIALGVAGGLTGIAAIAAAGVAGGAAIGLKMSRNINKKRGGVGDARIESEDGSIVDGRVAAEQLREDMAKKNQYLRDQMNSGNEVDVDEMTRITEIRTGDEKTGNRARTMAFTATGAGAGIVGAAAGGAIRDALDSAPSAPQDKPDEEKTEEEPTPPAPEIPGNDFEVEQDNGITQEIRDFGLANGKDIPPQVTYDIYNELRAERGDNGIIETGTYVMDNGDLGITNPGASGWQDGVAQSILEKLAARGY